MKKEDFLRSMGSIDEKYIEEAQKGLKRKRFDKRKLFYGLSAAAAVILLLLAVRPLIRGSRTGNYAADMVQNKEMEPDAEAGIDIEDGELSGASQIRTEITFSDGNKTGGEIPQAGIKEEVKNHPAPASETGEGSGGEMNRTTVPGMDEAGTGYSMEEINTEGDAFESIRGVLLSGEAVSGKVGVFVLMSPSDYNELASEGGKVLLEDACGEPISVSEEDDAEDPVILYFRVLSDGFDPSEIRILLVDGSEDPVYRNPLEIIASDTLSDSLLKRLGRMGQEE